MFLRSRSAPLPGVATAGRGTPPLHRDPHPTTPLSPPSHGAPDPLLFYVSLNDDDDEEEEEEVELYEPRPRIFRRSFLGGSARMLKVPPPPAPFPSVTAAAPATTGSATTTGSDPSKTRPARSSTMRRLFRKLGLHHGGSGAGAARRGEDYDVEWSSSEKELLGPCPTQSFSTLDETDEDDDGGGGGGYDQLLVLGPSFPPDRRHHASILAAQERGVPTAVRWSDQQLGGSVVTSIMEFPYARPAYLRVVILLLHPVIRRFEFLHCELPEQRLTVWDLLQQLPGLATEPSLKHVAFHSLCRHRRSCKRRKKKRKTSQTKPLIELISTGASSSFVGSSSGSGSSASYEDDGAPADEEIAEDTATDPKQVELIHRLDIHCYELFEGEILLAIPNGFHPKSIIKHTDSMLENRQLMRMLHRAKLSGRALRRLKPSKTYESTNNKSGGSLSRSPRPLHHSPRIAALPVPPPPPPPASPYSLKPKSRSTPPASPKVYQPSLQGPPSPSRNSPPKSASPRSSGSPTTPPRAPSRRGRDGGASSPARTAKGSDGSPRSVVVKAPPGSGRSILQPDLGPVDVDDELDMHIQRAAQRELLLLQRVDRVDDRGAERDDGITEADVEDDSGVVATDDERFFGSITVDPSSHQLSPSPFEFPRLIESDVSSMPADCHSLASRQLGVRDDSGAFDEEGRLSWERWISHYFMCGSDARCSEAHQEPEAIPTVSASEF